MKTKLLTRNHNNPKLSILREIKKSQGLSVTELCQRVGLSYMGIKQHCIGLEREGYLDTWRRPKGMGRPEKAYRLTDGAKEFFPSRYPQFSLQILESVKEIYGSLGPEKILHNIYKAETQRYETKLEKLDGESRFRGLTQLREEDGYMAEYSFDNTNRIHRITEFNSAIQDCLDAFPMIRDYERQMFEKILRTKIRRDEERISGLYRCTYSAASVS
ncbi:MAG: winged helix-turn-helix transcriptional regulator [Verrucomicrobia bacterium]|jgi:predicted ArsR family transcriptional regulator|nr:winged helix-turn-helix transcriptional regulator [Verrucomicrobiota bacterium]